MKIIRIFAFTQILLIASCSQAPVYEVPRQAVPDNYKELGPWKIATPSDDLIRGDWWTLFNDPVLNSLESRVDGFNQDLAAALARYNQARAYETQANSAVYPTIQGGAAVTRNRQSDDRPLRGSNQPDYYGANTIGFSASYELDLWDRVHSLIAASKAKVQASAADLESTRLTLHANLASDYIELRGLDVEKNLLSETMESYQAQQSLIEKRYRAGMTSALDVAREQTQLEEVQAQIADIAARRSLLEHAIAVLVGEPASSLTISSSVVISEQPDIPVSIPSTLLQRRPDISSAERRVAAANAEIGIARAAFFPSIILGLQGGVQNTGGLNLLSLPNSFWSIGPSALFTLFDGGRREAEVKQLQARTDEVASQYRGTVLRAFKEVEDNLVLIHQLQQEYTSEQLAVLSAKRSLELSTNKYRAGGVSHLEVIDAQMTLLRVSRTAVSISTRSRLASIGLIRALGGGWEVKHNNETSALSSQ